MRPTPAPPSRPAKQYALWLLGRREWSQKELGARLAQKGYLPDDIAQCLEFCNQHGLQSDIRFASSRTRMRAKTHGNQRILQELKQKGVASDIVQAALQETDSERTRAQSAIRRFEGLELTQQLKAKAWRFLSARGFSSSAIRDALTFLGANCEDPEPD